MSVYWPLLIPLVVLLVGGLPMLIFGWRVRVARRKLEQSIIESITPPAQPSATSFSRDEAERIIARVGAPDWKPERYTATVQKFNTITPKDKR